MTVALCVQSQSPDHAETQDAKSEERSCASWGIERMWWLGRESIIRGGRQWESTDSSKGFAHVVIKYPGLCGGVILAQAGYNSKYKLNHAFFRPGKQRACAFAGSANSAEGRVFCVSRANSDPCDRSPLRGRKIFWVLRLLNGKSLGKNTDIRTLHHVQTSAQMRHES